MKSQSQSRVRVLLCLMDSQKQVGKVAMLCSFLKNNSISWTENS